ncbi:class I SAM-dependent methyltransferase [Micromonospora sp. NPDC004704]
MPTERTSYGAGPGPITPDGCAVDVYAQLPPNGEPEIIHRAVPPGARILELGCGTGRLSNPLAELGHRVVGVDESATMLARLRGVEPVAARIEDLRLNEHFDIVLLASHLINTASDEQRRLFLRTCRRHLGPGGQLVAQWHPPEWFDSLRVGTSREGVLGPVVGRLDVLDMADGLLTAETSYQIREDVWIQRFTARRLTDRELTDELRSAGLDQDQWLDDGRRWFTARRLSPVVDA